MDSILIEQIEWLLSGNLSGIRHKRQMVLVAGCLAGEHVPEHIERQIESLCRQISLQEAFDSLLTSLNKALGNAKNENPSNFDINAMVAQVEAARVALYECAPVNEAQLITWMLGLAKERKLITKIGYRR